MNEPMYTSHRQNNSPTPLTSPTPTSLREKKVRAERAKQACEPCRQKKRRCDSQRPKCTFCQTSGQPCTYSPERPVQTRKRQKSGIEEESPEVIESKFEVIKETIGIKFEVMQSKFESKFEVMQSKLDKLLGSPLSDPSKKARVASPPPPSVQSSGRETSDVSRNRDMSHSSDSRSENVPSNNSPTTQESLGNEKKEITRCGAIEVKRVQSLLKWPSIERLLPKDHDKYDVREMEKADTIVWLHGFGSSHTRPENSTGTRVEVGIPSGLQSSVPTCPTPAYDVEQIDHYFHSYRRNIGILHPIVDEAAMRGLAASAKQDHGRYESQLPTSPSNTLKRKRHETNLPTRPSTREPKSYKVAVALSIMALGEISSYKKPFRQQTPASAINMPELISLESFDSSIPDSELDSKLAVPTWNHQEMQTWKRSIPDAVPGRASYIAAADILCRYQDRNYLMLIQACLLVGLYAGQLTQVCASHAWISEACRVCQVLIES